MSELKLKLAGMRKADHCSTLLMGEDGNAVTSRTKNPTKVMVQGDRIIGLFDIETGEGVLAWRGSHEKYFAHLAAEGEPYTLNEEDLERCLKAAKRSGDTLGPGVRIA